MLPNRRPPLSDMSHASNPCLNSRNVRFELLHLMNTGDHSHLGSLSCSAGSTIQYRNTLKQSKHDLRATPGRSTIRKLSRNGRPGVVAEVAEARRILSSTAGSEPLGKFSTLLYFSKGCQTSSLRRFDPIRPVLNMGTTTVLLQSSRSRSIRSHQNLVLVSG
jgi:hypothetical protein